ncbi:MAG: hypothetical protein D6714_14765 [Bacteroidetes bacterium]|nr:MAG: hypothetical protein D6714_14765 [Bacteroidota bacterium]
MKWLTLLGLWAALFVSCTQKPSAPFFGQKISASVTFPADTFRINGTDSLRQGVLIIEGDDIVVDFGGGVLIGSTDQHTPDGFYGLGILIKNSKNVTLKNARIHGFKVAVRAENVTGLRLEDCDFSYNYRPRLRSVREREDLSDWLSFHENDHDEWLRYGMAVYLKNCDGAVVRGVHITGGQNGLMMTGCSDGLFYNNTIQFNSGVGLGLYRSSRNRVFHNRLDWNVRGYSHGFYRRGQDSAGILVYEQSHDNVFAYNSATHSGDGFFLWAGQSTMESGSGGCNGNIIYGNDFSHAPTNGIEITFSSNRVFQNRLEECRYGIWGGYSHDTEIGRNDIRNCDFGIAIEHGQHNTIFDNRFKDDSIGIQLWQRAEQPADWGYAQKRDVSGRDYRIINNRFSGVARPLDIRDTRAVRVTQNQTFQSPPLSNFSDPKRDWHFSGNTAARTDFPPPETTPADSFFIEKLPDGQDAFLPEGHPRGLSYILVNEWGPYDFRYPVIWLRTIEDNRYVLLLLGPHGNWKCVGGRGLKSFGPKTGTFPATIIAEKLPGSDEIGLDLEFIGEAVTDQFGRQYPRGTVFPFSFYRYQKEMIWSVKWYAWDETTDPLKNESAFRQLKNQKPQKSETTRDLAYTWWRSPGAGLPADNFATFASTTVDMAPGKYRIRITSDDGLRFYIDGERKIDHWDIHVPATDEIEVELGGRHTFEIEHFEGGGLATLSFAIEPVRQHQ